MILIDQQSEFLDFANKKLNTKFLAKDCAWIVSIGNVYKGVVVYSRMTPWNCEMSMAGWGAWITRPLLRAAFHYPFNTCKLIRVTAVVEDGNERSMSINKRLGFIEEGRLSHWFGDKDGIILRMLRSECKWI